MLLNQEKFNNFLRMEDDKVGLFCKYQACRQKDWLPVKCKYCSEIYCADHYSIQSHNCSQHSKNSKKIYTCPLCNKNLDMNMNLTVDQNFSIHQAMDCKQDFQKNVKKINKCGYMKCHNVLTLLNQYNCNKCRKKFCLKHRIQQQHQCVKV